MTKKKPAFILHIPHSSMTIPLKERGRFILSDKALEHELLVMTDHFTDELFDLESSIATKVIFPISRLVVDAERFLDDQLEIMAKQGMGVLYTHGSEKQIIRESISSLARQEILSEWYIPHHQKLNEAVGKSLEHHDFCLVIDCHSFPGRPLPYELNQSMDRPDICIGTDDFHTPGWLVNAIGLVFKKSGFSVKINHPFAGSLVPSEYYLKNENVFSVMIEINRALYMDEISGKRLADFDKFSENLKRKILEIIKIVLKNRKLARD